ncbi:MAG TPA: hypothetical protein DEA08_22365 [Planctomycetes bacterium]|nr:hypothetical protein [Planctomycetota bacterium]
MALTFVFFLLAFVAVGLLSARARGEGADDYWLAGRSLPPWAMALSTLSTAQRGFLFLGMVGLSYAKGLTALWMLAGWLGGDYLVWRLGVIDRIRRTSEARGTTTLPAFLGPQERAGEERKRPLWVAITALALFALLSLSASGQLTSGAKVLSGLYGWPRWAGLGLTALIVTSYCFAGGVRASVWTDCAQGPVMIVGMLWLMSAGLIAVGGPGELWARLQTEYPGHLALTENWGWALVGLLGWTISGMGTSGQPHVLSRAFMIDDPENLVRARRWYFGLGLLLYGTVVVAGLCARLLVPAGALADNELAIVTIAEQLLPAPAVGLMVAGIFAAVISTVDSMVIVQSSVLVNDVAPEGAELPASATKVFTLLAMLLALVGVLLRELRGLRLRTPAEHAWWARLPVVASTRWTPRGEEADEDDATAETWCAFVGDLEELAGVGGGETLVVAADPALRSVGVALARLAPVAEGAPREEPPDASAAPRPFQVGTKRFRAWPGPERGAALRRACRDADRVLVLVPAGAFGAATVAGIAARIGRAEGVGLALVGVGPDLEELSDQVGEVEAFWAARSRRRRALHAAAPTPERQP